MKYPEIAKRFRLILSERKMSQKELADKAGVNKSFISHYVNGSHCPSNVTAQKIAEALGVSPLWLMDLSVHKTTEDLLEDIHRLDQESIAHNPELQQFIKAYLDASPALRNAALAVLESGAQSPDSPQKPQDKG